MIDHLPTKPQRDKLLCRRFVWASSLANGRVEIGEIQPVLIEIGQTLRFIPNDFHRVQCSYNLSIRQRHSVATIQKSLTHTPPASPLPARPCRGSGRSPRRRSSASTH